MIVDFIVTRKEDDPIHYREVVDRHTEVNLIEVPYNVSCTAARRDLVNIGTADYVMYFDPDDTLYEGTLTSLLGYIKRNPHCSGIMCLSDYIDPFGKPRQIIVDRIKYRAVNGHCLKVLRRDVLVDILSVCSDDVICWQITAGALSIGVPVLPFSGYLWNVDETRVRTGDHTFNKISPKQMDNARTRVRQILRHMANPITLKSRGC